jgi:exosortase
LVSKDRISAHIQKQSGNGILEEFRLEFLGCWERLPNKALFLALFAAWLALFHFLGNSTLGYVRTPSLLTWIYAAFTGGGRHLLDSEGFYGLCVPFVVLALFWLKRHELLDQQLRAWWPGLVLVGLGLVLHVVGYRVQQARSSIIGLVVGLYGLTGLAWGPAWLRRSFFPFVLLAFIFPLDATAITFRLRVLVTHLVAWICHYLLAIDVLVEGTMLRDPSNQYGYEVAAACSGIRSLMATFALATVISLLSFRKWWKRLLVIASALPLAILGNMLRLLLIVLAAELGGQTWGNAVHEGGPFGFFSLLPYVPALAGLLLLEHYWYDPVPTSPTPSTADWELHRA